MIDDGDVFEGQGLSARIIEGYGLELFAIDPVLKLSIGIGGEQFLGGFVEVVDENAVVGEERVLRDDGGFYKVRKEQGAI